jgi:hypothetical protein
VSQKLAKEKPEAVAGLVRAINKAMREVIASPDGAIDLLVKKEPLTNRAIERQRLVYVTKALIATPEATELGVGDIKDARMSEAIDTIATSYELARKPAVADAFNRAFLPTLRSHPTARSASTATGSRRLDRRHQARPRRFLRCLRWPMPTTTPAPSAPARSARPACRSSSGCIISRSSPQSILISPAPCRSRAARSAAPAS